MTANRLTCASMVLVAAVLAGCATSPAPDPTAEIPYCHKTNKGRVIACTTAAVPSLNADAQAKQFAPDPNALTVYVVRRNWGDGRNFVNSEGSGEKVPGPAHGLVLRTSLQSAASIPSRRAAGVSPAERTTAAAWHPLRAAPCDLDRRAGEH